jgi:CheY-like chemotaxis protein
MMPVVIVDDASEDLIFAERILRECKVLNPIVAMKTGQECIDYFKSLDPNAESPCLALIDLVMPQPNGVEVLRQLGNSHHAQRTIFVMLSGLADIKLIQQGYQHGARTFLVKPLMRDDVLRLFDAIKGIKITREREGYVLSFEPSIDLRGGIAPQRPGSESISLSS